MTNEKLKALVTRAVALDRSIAELEAQLKTYKERLTAEAKSRADDATATEGGGKSITFEGADGCIARVTTAGATLKSTIKTGDKNLEKIKALAGRCFGSLFTISGVYRLDTDFRAKADLYLNKDAPKLIRLCESPGKTTVSFETKEVAS